MLFGHRRRAGGAHQKSTLQNRDLACHVGTGVAGGVCSPTQFGRPRCQCRASETHLCRDDRCPLVLVRSPACRPSCLRFSLTARDTVDTIDTMPRFSANPAPPCQQCQSRKGGKGRRHGIPSDRRNGAGGHRRQCALPGPRGTSRHPTGRFGRADGRGDDCQSGLPDHVPGDGNGILPGGRIDQVDRDRRPTGARVALGLGAPLGAMEQSVTLPNPAHRLEIRQRRRFETHSSILQPPTV